MKTRQALTLSVVIPVYNEGAYLAKCLDAIAAQTVMPDQVVIVDNNSTDDSAAVAASYDFVTLVHEAQQGVLFARDAGFAAATGTIICRIDADTILAPDWMATVRSYYEKHPEVAAITGDCTFYDFPFESAFQTVHHFGYYTVQKLIAGTEILWGSNMAITRESWDAVQPYCLCERGVHEDIDLSLQLQNHGYRIARLRSLKAGVSLRRGNLGPREIIDYLKPWPATYWRNKRVLQTALIWLALSFVLVATLPPAAILSAIRTRK